MKPLQSWQREVETETIEDIKNAGLEVEKIIINSNLTEEEAFATESLSVDEYERINDTAPLEEKDIRHKILVIKINRLYQKGMDDKVLYDAVRGVWRASNEKVKSVEYVSVFTTL